MLKQRIVSAQKTKQWQPKMEMTKKIWLRQDQYVAAAVYLRWKGRQRVDSVGTRMSSKR